MWRDYWQRYRRFWWVPCIMLALLGGGILWQRTNQQRQVAANQQLMARPTKTKHAKSTKAKPKTPSKGGFVDVKGAVRQPGIYPITVAKTRLFEVLKNAGDVTDAADTRQLNLAQTLDDQVTIYVPTKGEALAPEELIKPATQPQTQTTTSDSGSNRTTAASAATTDKVNLNQADSTQLQTLNGVGPKKAEQIIAYRDEQGGFKQIEDLQKVSGIGPKTFEQLRPQICVN